VYNSVSMAMAVREGYLRPVTMARPVDICVFLLMMMIKLLNFVCGYYYFLSSVGEGGRGRFCELRDRGQNKDVLDTK
jgi:hypothetical protein